MKSWGLKMTMSVGITEMPLNCGQEKSVICDLLICGGFFKVLIWWHMKGPSGADTQGNERKFAKELLQIFSSANFLLDQYGSSL